MTQQTAEKAMAMNAAYLEDLLTRQVDRLRGYDLDGAMTCAEQSEALAAELTADGYLDRPENADAKARVQTLYRELMLMIASQRQEVSDKLDQIRQGLKSLNTYSD